MEINSLEVFGIMLVSILIAIGIWQFYIVKRLKIENKRERTRISFRESMALVELPLITFYNNKVPLTFLLDTGANLSFIDSNIVSKLEYKEVNRKTKVESFTGHSIESNVCNLDIDYLGFNFNYDFSVTDLSHMTETINHRDIVIHGVLGSKFFQRYKYVLDFDKLVAHNG